MPADESAGGIRPETLALRTLIEASLGRFEESADNARSDSLQFLGNRHTAFPILVVQDPVLEPVDKLVWMAIKLQAETGGSTAFPTYDAIRKTANIASKSTVARAIAVLRATRWLTLCARLREHSGRFRGNKTTTTTTTGTENRTAFEIAGEAGAPLVYPQRLSENQRELADRYLSRIATHQRQRILDELEGRFCAEEKGMQPLYDEMSFLFSLCKAMKNGEFKENLGMRVREARMAREQARQTVVLMSCASALQPAMVLWRRYASHSACRAGPVNRLTLTSHNDVQSVDSVNTCSMPARTKNRTLPRLDRIYP